MDDRTRYFEYLLKLSGGSANDDDCDKVDLDDDGDMVDICRTNDRTRCAYFVLPCIGAASCRCNDRLVKNELFANADMCILCCGLEYVYFDGYEETEDMIIRKKMARVMMLSY